MPVRDILNAASGAASYGPSDFYFYDVSLLLNGDGTNGAQNNTFLDSSSNAFTITRNGNTTQGSFSPYGNLWSNYFSASSAYLSLSAQTALNVSGGNWTIEFWYFRAASAATTVILENNSNGTGGYSIQTDTSNNLVFYVNSNVITSSSSMPLNTWNHCALVRNGSTTTMYLNGSSVGTSSTDAGSTNGGLWIGARSGGSFGVAGYLSNLRIVKGTAVYTGSTYTVPTAPLTAITNTSLLTCQSNRFIDNSSNAFSITANGSPSVQRFSPFNPTAPYDTATIGGSGYFDGSGDYLTIPNNTALNPDSGDFTLECWINTSATIAYQTIANNYGSPTSNNGLYFCLDGSGTGLYLSFGDNSSIASFSGGSGLNDGAWHHVAAVRTGTTLSLYKDGTRIATTTSSLSINSTADFRMSGWTPGGRDWNGYISNFRMIKGSGPYDATSTTLTVPTAPLTAITNTTLLTNFTNAGIPDLAMQNNLQTVGNAQVSTSVKKYGTGSLSFDGSNSGLYMPPDQAFAFGTGDYTIEFWVYYASTSANYVFVDMRGASGSGTAPVIYMTGSVFYVGYAGTNVITTTPPSINTWHHIALCRSSGSTKLFIDGTQAGSTYSDSNNVSTAYYTTIGYYGGGGYVVNGYIDDFRVTSGYARYTANFTPPTAALPTY